jgi:hypothetical protein
MPDDRRESAIVADILALAANGLFDADRWGGADT